MPVWRVNGEQADLTGSTWVIVLEGAVILTMAAVLIALPIGLANRRKNPARELVMAGAILWGLATVWSALSVSMAQYKWGHERDILVQSGYYDPATQGDGPRIPWVWWGVLGAAYPVLLGWAYGRKAKTSPPAPRTGGSHQPG